LRKGKIALPSAPEEVTAAMLRYRRAAEEGTARLNLRLMAKVLAGQAFIGNLKADEFLYHAEMLASLRREEILLIATMQKVRRQDPTKQPHQLWPLVLKAVVPALFPSGQEAGAVAGACQRTGLVTDGSDFDNAGYYVASPLIDGLERLACFEEALDEECKDARRQEPYG
jgi:hypothetical protein